MPTDHFLEDFSIGDNQYSGPRPESVEEKVYLLDPGSSSRGQGNCQGQVGCADGDSGLGQMGKAEGGICGTDGEIESPLFFVDGDASSCEPFGIYVRATEAIIGDEQHYDSTSLDLGTSRCFNCGSPDHIVSACPTPLNRQLISLSRQFFNFIQSSRGITDFQRIHIVEEWRQKRLQWVDTFEPGEIRGSLLLDALGSDDGDWLKNMAVWGYPKGWVAVTDPREHVRQLIEKEYADSWNDDVEDPEPFVIFGDDHEVETIYSNGINCQTLNNDTDSDYDSDTTSSSMEASISDLEQNDTTPTKPIRWAQYPPTQFASHLLPVYTGSPLPPISHCGSMTYTTDRQDLWQRITSGQQSSMIASPSWRLPGTYPLTSQFHNGDSNFVPPPPTTEPPPLPPPPVLDGHVPPMPSVSSFPVDDSPTKIPQRRHLLESDDCEGSDMDVSDSE
jgi:zinc finger CCHC domain-containing protein 8